LAPIHDPALLARAPRLADDIKHLLTLLPSSAEKSIVKPSATSTSAEPLPPFAIPPFLEPVFLHSPAPLKAYIDHLRSLASSVTTAPSLLAHAYVRYLGDLSGGQVIGARIRKSYNLKGMDGASFYEFADSASDDGIEEKKKHLAQIKAWFRRGMDEGVGDDKVLKGESTSGFSSIKCIRLLHRVLITNRKTAHLVKEANLSFYLNTYLFTLIRPDPSTQLARQYASSAPHDLTGRQERYYDRMQREREFKREQKRLQHRPNTWWERIERFVLTCASAFVGMLIVKYGMPYLEVYRPAIEMRIAQLAEVLTRSRARG
jgi:hypothetical protein